MAVTAVWQQRLSYSAHSIVTILQFDNETYVLFIAFLFHE